jgi:WD40 repeat protein
MTRCLAILCLATTALAQPRVDQHGDPLPEGAISRFGTLRFRLGPFGATDLAPDGKTLAVESKSGITLWDVESGLPVRRLADIGSAGWYSPVPQLRFSPDGKYLAHLRRNQVRIWDPTNGKPLFDIALWEDRSPVRAKWSPAVPGIGFFPNSSQFAVTRGDSKVLVCDASKGTQVSTLTADAEVYALCPSGRYFLGGLDGERVLIDAKTGRVQTRFPETKNLGNPAAVLSSDDRQLFVFAAGRLRIFDGESGKKLNELEAPPALTRAVRLIELVLSADGRTACVGGEDLPTQRCDLKLGKWIEPLPTSRRVRLLLHPDEKNALSLGEDGILRRWELANGKELPLPDGFAEYMIAAPSPDGTHVAITSIDGRLELFETTGKRVWSARTHSGYGRPTWSPDGRWLVTAGNIEVTLWDAASAKILHRIKVPEEAAPPHGPITFTPTSSKLIVPGRFGEGVAVFDPADGKRLLAMRTRGRGPAAVSPDGKLVAVQDSYGVRTILNLESQESVVDRDGPGTFGSNGSGLAYSPDGIYLLSWDLRAGAILREPTSGRRLRAFNVSDEVSNGFAFSPSGLWLAIGGERREVSLWDVERGRELGRWAGHRDQIRRIDFASPGRILSSSADLTALLWDLRPKEKPTKPLWTALSGDDALEAYRAIWAVADDPKGPELLRSKIAPAKPADSKQVSQWVADLGADKFAVRELATKELQALGRLVEAELRAARGKVASEEVRTRLDALLAKIPRERSATELVQARAVAAMELASSEAAKKLLAEWAAGAPGARLTIDAKAALGRLNAAR